MVFASQSNGTLSMESMDEMAAHPVNAPSAISRTVAGMPRQVSAVHPSKACGPIFVTAKPLIDPGIFSALRLIVDSSDSL